MAAWPVAAARTACVLSCRNIDQALASRPGLSISGAMTRSTRSADWGFPRWRGYGSSREATQVRMCDRYGCDQPGNCPAPKSPNSPERWYFCHEHAGEYNRGWNYFEGLTAEEAAAREADETRAANGFAEAKHYSWGGPGDGTRSRGASSTAMPRSTRCARRGASSPRNITPTCARATPRRPSVSRRSRRPMTCSRRPRTRGPGARRCKFSIDALWCSGANSGRWNEGAGVGRVHRPAERLVQATACGCRHQDPARGTGPVGDVSQRDHQRAAQTAPLVCVVHADPVVDRDIADEADAAARGKFVNGREDRRQRQFVRDGFQRKTIGRDVARWRRMRIARHHVARRAERPPIVQLRPQRVCRCRDLDRFEGLFDRTGAIRHGLAFVRVDEPAHLIRKPDFDPPATGSGEGWRHLAGQRPALHPDLDHFGIGFSRHSARRSPGSVRACWGCPACGWS